MSLKFVRCYCGFELNRASLKQALRTTQSFIGFTTGRLFQLIESNSGCSHSFSNSFSV